MAIVRRKRLQDGSFGELEKVFDGLTDSEQIAELGQQLALEKLNSMQKDLLINSLGEQLTQMKIDIMLMKGGAE